MSSQVTSPQAEQAAEPQSMFSSLMSYFVPTAHADEGDDEEEKEDGEGESEEKEEEEPAEEEEEEEEEDEDEPEDIAPAIREQCEKGECAEPAKHFKHCAEKVEGGKGWQGEDCVEELFHVMHCVDACAAPRLFRRLA